MSANVSQNYYVLGQAPLDAKIVFKNKQAFIDYTLNNEFFAFSFYKGMLVYLQEEEIICIWEFAYSPIYKENEKILPNNFIYPLGTVFNGLDYSEKAFNLIEIPLNKSNLGQWDLNTNDERTLTIVVDENTISNVFVPEQITQLWPNAEKISFIDGNIQGIKFQGKQIEYFEEFSLLDWDQLTYEIWNPDLAYIQNAKMKIVMIGENIDYTQYENRILTNSFTEAKIIHETVSAKNKNSIYFLNEENSFDILIVDKFFVVKKASDFFAKKDASNLSTYSVNWRTALDLYSRYQIDLKNNEQDDRLTAIEGENTSQNDLINDLFSELQSEKTRNDVQDSMLYNLEGINYIWSPTNRTLTLYDRGGTQLSQVSLVSLDNEGTDIRYNATTLSLELYNADNELLDSIPVSSFIGSVGTQLQLNSNQLQLKDSQGNVLSTVNFAVSNIQELQTALDGKEDISNKQNNLNADATNTKYPTVTAVNDGLADKQKKLSSFDESILIETDGNIEGNISLFEEYFEQQECELNFIPTQIIGVYQDGIKLLNSEYEIILPKKIKIKEYVDENIQIEYTHLKS